MGDEPPWVLWRSSGPASPVRSRPGLSQPPLARGWTSPPFAAPVSPVQTSRLQEVIRQNAGTEHTSLSNWKDFASLLVSTDGDGDLFQQMQEWTGSGRYGWIFGANAEGGYIGVKPVITGPGRGITQQDVALSPYEVPTCPWGWMPSEFMIDNGGEFGFLAESVIRFAAMAEISGLGVVKCRPYHPEGKTRIEGAFGGITRGFVNALPDYRGSNILKPRLKSRGKAVAPYGRGSDRLIEDLRLAIAQDNGTVQQGDLAGLSPKAMRSAKTEATGWQAQRIDDPDMSDPVSSREERRDVRQGTITIGKRRYSSGPVLAELIGEKQVPVLVPRHASNGPVILVRDGIIHHLTEEPFT